MTLDEYLDQFPDYGKDEETIEACLLDAEYIVNYAANSYGKTVPREAWEQAVGFQTAYMLNNCGDPEDYFLEVSLTVLDLISRGAQIYG